MRKMKTKKSKGEFSFEILDVSTPNTKIEFSVYGYSKPDGALYVNGVWIDRIQMQKMAEAMFKALEFSK
ncbi:MAG: hypothetical protein ACRCST_00730 [Turicibacter sp.]